MEKVGFVNPFRSLQFVVALVFSVFMSFLLGYIERTKRINLSSVMAGSFWWLITVYLLWLTGHNTWAWLATLFVIVLSIFSILAIDTIPGVMESLQKTNPSLF